MALYDISIYYCSDETEYYSLTMRANKDGVCVAQSWGEDIQETFEALKAHIYHYEERPNENT